MKLNFLGTSHGVPSKDRFCQSILLETNGQYYIFDAGAPISDLLLRIDVPFEKVNSVFISHMHSDHTVGLFHFINLSTWYYKNTKFKVLLPEESAIDDMRYISEKSFGIKIAEERIELSVYEDGKIFEDENIVVTAIRTNHLGKGRHSYCFIVEAEGKRILISGDLSPTLDDLPNLIDKWPFDFAVFECAHFEAEKILDKLNGIKSKKVAFIHVFPLEKYDVFEKNKHNFSFELIMPNDGDVITI